MCQKLPVNGYRWDDKLTVNGFFYYDESSSKGYFIECDLEYPEELHDYHSDYPLAPERICVKSNWLSPIQKEMYRKK